MFFQKKGNWHRIHTTPPPTYLITRTRVGPKFSGAHPGWICLLFYISRPQYCEAQIKIVAFAVFSAVQAKSFSSYTSKYTLSVCTVSRFSYVYRVKVIRIEENDGKAAPVAHSHSKINNMIGSTPNPVHIQADIPIGVR